MAVFPLRNRDKAKRAQIDLARLPVLAAAFLIALFGLLAGTPRNGDIAASARPIDDRSDRAPALTKREPLRAITVADRKDGTSSHVAGASGLPAPAFFIFPAHVYAAAKAPARRAPLVDLPRWPGALPRAPPMAA